MTFNGEQGKRIVVITGMGVVSPVGIGKQSFWEALTLGQSGIRRLSAFDASSYPTQVAGEINKFDPTEFLSVKEARRMDRSCQMILAAAQMAAEDAGINFSRLDSPRVGVFTGTAIGGQGWAFKEYQVFKEKGLNRINPFTAVSTFPNASSSHISAKFGFFGPSITISSGCASSSLALGYAVDNIRLGRIDMAFVGGTEAPLEPGIFGAYCAARVMTTQNEEPYRVPRPFDLRRDGIVLSEGAGVLVCESLEHALERGARIYAAVYGWAHNSDSRKLTVINPDGPQAGRVLRQAITDSGLRLEDIDLVMAHAAGTKADDKTEVMALRSVFGDLLDQIPVTSVKSMLGHTQGACGTIETAAAAMVVVNHCIPPTINCVVLDSECSANVVCGTSLKRPVRFLLVNTFGFGGKNVAVVLGALRTAGAKISLEGDYKYS